jgi:hypothetical protein
VTGTTSTSTTTLASVLIPTKTLKLRSDSIPPFSPTVPRIVFRSDTKRSPQINRIFTPLPNGSRDPRLVGAELVVYNASGLTNDVVVVPLAAPLWSLRGTAYRYKADRSQPVHDIVFKTDVLKIKGGNALWSYVLNEPMQGRVAVQLRMGTSAWCADAPAKVAGSPPSSARFDRVDLFMAQAKSPPPSLCPPLPGSGSPSGAFLDEVASPLD